MRILIVLLLCCYACPLEGFPRPQTLGRQTPTVAVRLPLVNGGEVRGSGARATTSRLFLDLFGLGPTEVVIIAAAAALLYGPDRLKQQLRDRGVKGTIVSSGWKEERAERIKLMSDYAIVARKKRAWKRINEAIASEDPTMLDKMAAFEDDDAP